MRSWNRSLVLLAGSMVLLAVVCVAGLLLDPRTLGGQPIWAKPLKFSVSFVLYATTLAWMISLVSGSRAPVGGPGWPAPWWRSPRWSRWR